MDCVMSDDLDLEAGRLLFARPFVFVKGCVRISDLPPADRTADFPFASTAKWRSYLQAA